MNAKGVDEQEEALDQTEHGQRDGVLPGCENEVRDGRHDVESLVGPNRNDDDGFDEGDAVAKYNLGLERPDKTIKTIWANMDTCCIQCGKFEMAYTTNS